VQQLELELQRAREVSLNLKKLAMSCKKGGALCKDLKVEEENKKVEQGNTDDELERAHTERGDLVD
jgi:hypothetical protein